jgi:hypothetical protein
MRPPVMWPLSIAVLGVLVPSLGAQVPPGYELVQVTNDSLYQRNVRMNNRGQIVFWAGSGNNGNTYEIYLYDHGTLARITQNSVCDGYPDINDDGVIAWERFIGPQGPYGPTSEIMMYRDGVTTQLTHDAVDNECPRINNLGHIVWYDWIRGGCANSNAIVEFYDGQLIHQISDADWCNEGPQINDDDWVVWTRINYCDDPWTSQILLYGNGMVQVIASDQFDQIGACSINNRGQVAMNYNDGFGNHGIQVWDSGVTTTLTDWGLAPAINNRGDVYFIRWYEAQNAYQAWVYLSGRYYQLSSDPQPWFWSVDGGISDSGEVAWAAGQIVSYKSDVRYLRLIPPQNEGSGEAVVPVSARRAARH